MESHDRPYNDKWDDPAEHDGEYPPDWTARCLKAFESTEHTCQNCGWEGGPNADNSDRRLYGKHIIPSTGGGTNAVSNIAVVCSECYTPDKAETDETHPTQLETSQGDTVHEQTPEQGEIARKLNTLISKFDMFPEPSNENGQYTLYQTFLRLGLITSFIAIVVMFFYQLIVVTRMNLHSATVEYTIPVYATLVGLPIVLAWFLDFKVGPEFLTDEDEASTHYHAVKLMTIIMFATLTIYYGTKSALPVLGSSGEIYGTMLVGALTVIYGFAAFATLITITAGVLEARYKILFNLRPMVWIATIWMILGLYLWTWLILGDPYAATEPVYIILPGIFVDTVSELVGVTVPERVAHAVFLDALVILFPTVAVAYMGRLWIAVHRQKKKIRREQQPH